MVETGLGEPRLPPWCTFPDCFLSREHLYSCPPASRCPGATQWPLVPSISTESYLPGSQHRWYCLSPKSLSHPHCSTVMSCQSSNQDQPTFVIGISIFWFRSPRTWLLKDVGVSEPMSLVQPWTLKIHRPVLNYLELGDHKISLGMEDIGGCLYPQASLQRRNLPAASNPSLRRGPQVTCSSRGMEGLP